MLYFFAAAKRKRTESIENDANKLWARAANLSRHCGVAVPGGLAQSRQCLVHADRGLHRVYGGFEFLACMEASQLGQSTGQWHSGHIRSSDPLVLQQFSSCGSLLGVHHQHLGDKLLGVRGYIVPIRRVEVVLPLTDLLEQNGLRVVVERGITT
ncbi:hypothetical protein GQ600_23935 [Phytophthora cactorum]|nr:hypothetical protein GQ600_23935 [Phytophthora cactorum]